MATWWMHWKLSEKLVSWNCGWRSPWGRCRASVLPGNIWCASWVLLCPALLFLLSSKAERKELSVVAGELFSAKQYLLPCMSTSIHFEYFEEQIKFPIAKFSFCRKGQESLGTFYVCVHCYDVFCANVAVGGKEKVNKVVISMWIEAINVACIVRAESSVKNPP